MKHSISALALGASILALGSTACEARDCDDEKTVEVEEGESQSEEGACVKLVSLANWEGEKVEEALTYQTDGNITIDGNNGSITVMEGDTDEIGVVMTPVVARAHDICDGEEEEANGYCAAINNDLSKFNAILDEDANGNWVIEANLDGGRATLKADIEVWLPTTFNGELTIQQNNGSTDVEGVHGARSVIIDSGNGSVDLFDSGSASSVVVEADNGGCDLDVGIAEEIDINCKNGGTDVVIRGVPEGDGGRYIENGLGDVTVTFPNTDDPYTVQAVSAGEPITVTGSCEEADGSTPKAVTMACNYDNIPDSEYVIPNYVVQTDSPIVDITLNL